MHGYMNNIIKCSSSIRAPGVCDFDNVCKHSQCPETGQARKFGHEN